MKKVLLALVFFSSFNSVSQVNEDQLGSWYIYFFSKSFDNSQFGMQGDVQFRNWNLGGDLEQLLIRVGPTYTLKKSKLKFTLGYAYVISGAYGINSKTTYENRIYQEFLQPHKIGKRIFLTHRLRTEQRFVQNQNFRTRYRYTLFANIPLNKESLLKSAFYLAFYDEIFINGETNTGISQTVNLLDRNRAYLACGYMLRDNLRVQFGIMYQTSTIRKWQLQYSLHHNF